MAMKVLFVVCLLATWCQAFTLKPEQPQPYDLVRVITEDAAAEFNGACIVDGKFAEFDSESCGGKLMFVGRPGSYLLIVRENGVSTQKVLNIDGAGPTPPPPPPPPPPTPTGFEASIKAALESIGNPPSKAKVANAYREIAEKANSRRDIWKPALMVDQVKAAVSSSLSIAEGQTWAAFWPKMNEAAKALQLDAADTDAFIKLFRQFADILDPPGNRH